MLEHLFSIVGITLGTFLFHLFTGKKTTKEILSAVASAGEKADEAAHQATEAVAQASSTNRKVASLTEHLEGKGVITPSPTRVTRSSYDPVTLIGPNPLLSKKPPR